MSFYYVLELLKDLVKLSFIFLKFIISNESKD